jgi:hypothetical protein
MNQNICYYPWVGIDIGMQHDFRPCCKYSNIIANTLEDYLASDYSLPPVVLEAPTEPVRIEDNIFSIGGL